MLEDRVKVKVARVWEVQAWDLQAVQEWDLQAAQEWDLKVVQEWDLLILRHRVVKVLYQRVASKASKFKFSSLTAMETQLKVNSKRESNPQTTLPFAKTRSLK